MTKNIGLGQPLTKKEMKQVLGGSGTGGCCAHISPTCPDCGTGHWTCGLTMQQAKDKARDLAIWAQQNALQYPDMGYEGIHGMWCCSSCP
jgi:hypothetical protein